MPRRRSVGARGRHLRIGDGRVEVETASAAGLGERRSSRWTLTRRSAAPETPSRRTPEILRRLADAEKLHRHVDRFVHRDHHASSRRPSSFVTTSPDTGGLGENLRLLHRVLPDRGVEREQRPCGARKSFGDDARPCELFHEPLLVRRPACRRSARPRRARPRVDRVEGDGGGSAPALAPTNIEPRGPPTRATGRSRPRGRCRRRRASPCPAVAARPASR